MESHSGRASQEAAESESGGKQRETRSTAGVRKKITGKEVAPSYDGEAPLKEHRRRVDLFMASTGIDEEFRSGQLMEKLEGKAWLATQTIDVKKLRSVTSVSCLLQHLQQELEPSRLSMSSFMNSNAPRVKSLSPTTPGFVGRCRSWMRLGRHWKGWSDHTGS